MQGLVSFSSLKQSSISLQLKLIWKVTEVFYLKRVNQLIGKRPMEHRELKSWSFLSCVPGISYLLSLRPISPIFNRDKTNSYLHGFAVRPKLSNVRERESLPNFYLQRSATIRFNTTQFCILNESIRLVFNNSTNIYFFKQLL